jgi:hypothetical protein
MSSAIPVSAYVSVFRGTEFVELTSAAEHVTVLKEGHPFPDSFEQGDSSRGPWVSIDKADLDRRFERIVTALWDGERVPIRGCTGDLAHIAFSGSPAWAADHALDGSQYEGWSGSVPVSQLADIEITERELS